MKLKSASILSNHLMKAVANFYLPLVLLIIFGSCEKDLKLNYDDIPVQQVIIANLTPNTYLKVNISKSKSPNDFSSVDFLSNCKVDVYEDGIFRETLPFFLKDTLTGLGYYTSTFRIRQNKTYKIISTHAELGISEATEYLPPFPNLVNFALLQHADSLHPNSPGQYIIAIQDSADFNNYYYLSTYYRVLTQTISNTGDTLNNYDIISIPSYSSDIPNLNNSGRSFTTDANFDGQLQSFTVTFPSQYNNVYKEILLVVEFSGLGKNFYEWNLQLNRFGTDYFNDGQAERLNLKSNIINGYGHFTANSSVYIRIPVK